MKKFPPLDLSKLKTYHIKDRPSKVPRSDFGRPWEGSGSLSDFISRLPNILAAKDFTEIVDRLAKTVESRGTLILAMGGHPIKVGLGPVIIDLMNRGIISLLAVNGSVMVHDTETALVGATSEDVQEALKDGTFGMARETAQIINQAALTAVENNIGLGNALGQELSTGAYEFNQDSVFAGALIAGVPVTVHVALGTDIVHIHPMCDGAAMGKASMNDFRMFSEAVATLKDGAFINLGSAVILPELFLKAISLARNLSVDLSGMTTVNMDFIKQYRPAVNVVQRPTEDSGKGFHLIGHHEIMFPLLAAALIEKLDGKT